MYVKKLDHIAVMVKDIEKSLHFYRDLLGLEVDVDTLLPADDASYGFDNIAGVLRMSPTLMGSLVEASTTRPRAVVGTAARA